MVGGGFGLQNLVDVVVDIGGGSGQRLGSGGGGLGWWWWWWWVIMVVVDWGGDGSFDSVDALDLW